MSGSAEASTRLFTCRVAYVPLVVALLFPGLYLDRRTKKLIKLGIDPSCDGSREHEDGKYYVRIETTFQEPINTLDRFRNRSSQLAQAVSICPVQIPDDFI
jgi:hypothetical protein